MPDEHNALDELDLVFVAPDGWGPAVDGSVIDYLCDQLAPVWELVEADPPAPPPKRLTVIERARPLLERLMAENKRTWHRLAVFPSSMAAGQTKGRLAEVYSEFEFRAVRVAEIGQSAIYVRWVGGAAKVLP